MRLNAGVVLMVKRGKQKDTIEEIGGGMASNVSFKANATIYIE